MKHIHLLIAAAICAIAGIIAVPKAQDRPLQYLFNGSTTDVWRTISLANFTVATTTTGRNQEGAALVEKSSRWVVNSAPAAGSQATASIAAEASVRHVVDCVSFSAYSGAVAPTATAGVINLRDGATGAGTVLLSWLVQITANASTQMVAPFTQCGLNLTGTTNTAMTLEFSGSLANLTQQVGITGYNVD